MTGPSMNFSTLRRRLNALAFVDEFGPVYAVYTLWFNNNGITTAQVSTIFVLWAAVAIVLEIPSGALADRVDRRHLVAVAFVLRAIGISTWMIWPTYWGALLGAALWAIHSSLASGAWEALIHDELEAVGHEQSYPTVMARVGQFSNLGIAAGTAIAAGLIQLGASIVSLGWVTVAIHAVAILQVVRLPDVRWVAGDDETSSWSYAEWLGTLRSGVRQARTAPVLPRLIGAGALLEGLFVFDEYVPLLARDRGAVDAAVPILVLVVWIGLLAGGELAARRPDISNRVLGVLVGLAAIAIAAGLASSPVWLLGLIAIGYGFLEATWVLTDARLQKRVSGETRATVTSVRGFLSGIVAMVVFLVIALMSDGDDPTPGLIVGAALLAVAGVLVFRIPD